MVEHREKIEGVECLYMKKSGKYDTKHLVVIFSSFSGDGKPFYSYMNSFQHVPADVLWIKDCFFGGESYYICANGEMNIEPAVSGLIQRTLDELGLTYEDCTFLGGSKGGSAALYYGLKYNAKNIISIVPQMHIGSYVEQDWDYAFKHMMGNKNPKEIKHIQSTLDRLITDQTKVSNKDKNIYIITSLADAQYEPQIKNNVRLFKRFENFNMIYANSDLIKRHNQVNKHILPITLSIINMCVMGLPPKLSSEEVKFRCLKVDGAHFSKPVITLGDFYIKDKKYYLTGDAYINGIPCPEYEDIKIYLVLRNTENKDVVAIPLAKDQRKRTDTGKRNNIYQSKASYDKGVYCTPRYNGLLIDELPVGSWNVTIRVDSRGFIREAGLNPSKNINASGHGDINMISLVSDEKNTILNVKAM